MITELSTYKHLLVLTGLACMLGAYLWYLDISMAVNAFTFSNGTVMSVESSKADMAETTAAVVHFTSGNGKSIKLLFHNIDLNADLNEGQSVNLMYPAKRPHSAMIYRAFDLWGGPVYVVSIGSGLLLTGLVFIIAALFDGNKPPALNTATTALQTRFVNVEKNRAAEIDGCLPYCIYSQWRNPETYEIHFFQSKNLWTDPSAYIKGKKITVYVENDNLNEYSVDLSFLPRRIIANQAELNK